MFKVEWQCLLSNGSVVLESESHCQELKCAACRVLVCLYKINKCENNFKVCILKR